MKTKKPDKDIFLTPSELAIRWRGAITTKTLANWRWKKEGPPFTSIGVRVLYKLKDIEKMERDGNAPSVRSGRES